MHSDTRGYWSEGQTSEWCGELIDTNHGTLRTLATELGLGMVDLIAAEPPGSSDSMWFAGERYSADRLLADSAPMRDALIRDLDDAGTTDWSQHSPAGVELDSMSVSDWIGSRVPGGSDSPLGRLLDVAYTEEIGADTSDQSGLNIVYSLGFQPEDGSFSLFGTSDERFRIDGGNDQVPFAIAEELPEPVRLGWRLEAVRARSSGGVSLTFDAAGSRAEVVADIVVLALPFSVLRDVDCERAGFDARKRAAITELGAGENAKLALQFEARHWATRGPWGLGNGNSYADTGYLNTWEATRGQPGEAGILVNYTGGEVTRSVTPAKPRSDSTQDPAVARYAAELLTRLEPIYPGLTAAWNGKATLSVPMLDPFARASYPYYRPGQYHRFAGYERVRMGSVLFAGDHCSVEHQGFMEGAASEGQRAARDILNDLRL